MTIYEYAITARKTRKPILKEHYEDYFGYLSDIGEVGNVNYENTRGIHVHFILSCKCKINYKILKPTKYGWNIKAVPIYNRDGWVSYCEKDLMGLKPLSDKEHRNLRRKMIRLNCCNNNKVKLRA